MRVFPVAALAIAITAGSVGLSAPAAQAVLDPPVVIPIDGATDVVADAATEQVFVSTGSHDSVVVLTWTGAVVDTLTGIDGASGMALDAASGTVYIAEQSSEQIAAIDTTTLAVTHYSTTGTPCPQNVAVADGIVFYGYSGESCSSWGGIGVLDPSEADAAGVSTATASRYQPQVVAAAGILVVAERGYTPSTPSSYAISGSTLTHLSDRYNVGSNTQDLAIAPDASEVIVASGAPYEHPAFDPATLQTLYTYPTTNYPSAVAISDGGSLAALGTFSSYNDDIWLFYRGTTTASEGFEMEDLTPSLTLYPGGLALGGTERLFAIGWEAVYSDERYLVIQDLEAKQETSITLSAPNRVQVDDDVTITGRLGTGSEFAGQTLTVSRSTLDGGTTSLGTSVVQDDGTVSFTDSPYATGTVRYFARWVGDDTYAPAIGISAPMSVVRARSSLQVTTDASSYRAGRRATVTVTLDHRDKRRDILRLIRHDADGAREVRVGSFDQRTVTFRVRVTSAGHFEATYAASRSHRAATDESRPFNVTPLVRTEVDDYFRHDGNHWSLRPSITPEVTWTVTPSPVGACAVTILQVRTTEGWRTLRRSTCHDVLSSDSLTRRFDDRRHDGTRWRVRLIAGATETHEDVKSRWTYITFRALPSADRAV